MPEAAIEQQLGAEIVPPVAAPVQVVEEGGAGNDDTYSEIRRFKERRSPEFGI